mgnify:CR=1 FL=1
MATGITITTARSMSRLWSSPYWRTSARPSHELVTTWPVMASRPSVGETMRNAGGSLTGFGGIFQSDTIAIPISPRTIAPIR